MTRQRDFKALVRERMSKTHERYATARAHILGQQNRDNRQAETLFPGVLAGYGPFGGIQSGTAPLTNVLRFTGSSWAATGQPFTEAVVNGLCGGPGFLYAVFEYKGWPPLLSIALHARSMPDAYVAQGLGRLSVTVTKRETGTPAVAGRHLDAALDAGKPALCAMGLRTVAVVGRYQGEYWVDGRAPVPTRLTAPSLARGRAAYKTTKHRLVTIGGAHTTGDPLVALRLAISDTARSYVEPPVPKAFQVNCGFAGLEKWQRMLIDQKDKKAWPTLFDSGARACAGLTRAYGWIACFVAPGAGRHLYASFLDEASRLLDASTLAEAADGFRDAGRHWAGLADFIAGIDDPAVRRECSRADDRMSTLDLEGDCAAAENPMDLVKAQQAAVVDCVLTKDQARSVYAEMSARLGSIVAAERAAVAAMAPGESPRGRTRGRSS